MNCEICGCDPAIIVLLPIKKSDGCLNTMACLQCAENSGHYCVAHKIPHMGFESDDTTACWRCIEELVSANSNRAEEIYLQLGNTLPDAELDELMEPMELSCMMTGQSSAKVILRFIATKALRLNKSIDEIVSQIVSSKSVGIILN